MSETKTIICLILFFTALVLLLCCPVCISLTGGCMPNYSEGERSGELIKISKKGLILKSWEGQLVLNQFAIGKDGSNLFQFSAIDDEVGHKLEKLIGKKVTLKYHQYFIGPAIQSTNYTIVSVEEVK